MVVFSLSTIILSAAPKKERSAASNFVPVSSDITIPPVKVARSLNISFLLSPNPGDFTAQQFTVPLSLFTTSVANASPSTSSAIIKNGFPVFAIFSTNGKNSAILLIFLSVITMYGFSNSDIIFPASVTK